MSASSQGRQTTVRAAATQLQGVVGDVAENVRRLEVLIDEAAGRGAELIGLPECATSPLPFRPESHRTVLPPQNVAVDMLRTAAKRHGCRIGGSMLIAEDGHIHNRYHLVEPDGQVHLHDKDLPTMWENAFYEPGNDDGVVGTGLGRMGAAVCWELIRTGTVQRLRDRVDIVMTGTHWWTLPSNWGGLVNRVFAPLAQFNRYLAENAPVEFARRVGAPVVQGAHCGPFRSDLPLLPGWSRVVPYETEFVGASQIVDAAGQVLAARSAADGPGVVLADVDVGAREPVQSLEQSFWIPDLPVTLRAYWHHQNLCGKSYYRRAGRQAGLRAAETSSS